MNKRAIHFWATWCGPCIRTMPEIQRLHEKYQSKDVLVFGVNCWEESNAAAYMKDQRFTYKLLLKGESIAPGYRVEILPTIYVVGEDGKIIYRSVGVDEKLDSFLAKHLEGK